MAIHPIVVETFHSESQMSTCRGPKGKSGSPKSAGFNNWELWLSVQNLIDLEKFHRINENFRPAGGAREKVMESPKSLGVIPWRPWMSIKNVMAIHPIIEIFQSGPKWWTNIAIHIAMQLCGFYCMLQGCSIQMNTALWLRSCVKKENNSSVSSRFTFSYQQSMKCWSAEECRPAQTLLMCSWPAVPPSREKLGKETNLR